MLENVPAAIGHALSSIRPGLGKIVYAREDLAGPETMRVTSDAFARESTIPARYTQDGAKVSPPLRFAGVPEAARSLSLAGGRGCRQPDAGAARARPGVGHSGGRGYRVSGGGARHRRHADDPRRRDAREELVHVHRVVAARPTARPRCPPLLLPGVRARRRTRAGGGCGAWRLRRGDEGAMCWRRACWWGRMSG